MKQKNSLQIFLISLLISLVLHVFLVYKVKAPGEHVSSNSQDQNSASENRGNLDDAKTHIWVSRGIIPCETYDGIGIQFNRITCLVNKVAPGSPADKAGLKENDELVTPIWNIDLVFGQKIDLVVIRDGKHITLPIIVDRICHE